MPRSRSQSSSIIPILIVAAAISIWVYDAYKSDKGGSVFKQGTQKSISTQTRKTTEKSTSTTAAPKKTSGPERIGKYDVYRNCTLASDRTNDGDSFRVQFPDGKKEIVRLYFVDTPESAFKTYEGGENNHRRIQQQADDMGGITRQQAVKIGQDAKHFTLALLEKSPFTIYTEWDSPFNDQRYHAYVELTNSGKKRFLHELLVEKGFVRIHTKGAPMPDGTSERKHEDHLRKLEKIAKSAEVGGWGI